MKSSTGNIRYGIDNLHKEYQRRVGEEHEYLFEEYKLAFQVHFDNDKTEKMKECYRQPLYICLVFCTSKCRK